MTDTAIHPIAGTIATAAASATDQIGSVAASYADQVVFLADGRVVDELREPTAEQILDRMKALDATGPVS